MRGAVARAGLVAAVAAAFALAVPTAAGAAGAAGAAQPATPPAGWSLTPTPNGTGPTGQLLSGTCTSASSCTAVGTYVRASGVGVTLAERWSGTRWGIQPTPNPAGARVSTLTGVACTSPSACTAVGSSVSGSGVAAPLAERWNGTGWRLEPVPSPAGAQRTVPLAVACPSSASCTAVGYYATGSGAGRTLAEHWNGTRWAIQPIPSPAGAQFPVLNGVSCTAASACTAVGQTSQGTLAERWNGTRWAIQPTPSPAGAQFSLLNGVSCTAASACTAVGQTSQGTLAERWNGTRWAIQPTPSPAGSQGSLLNGVGCSSGSACTAVGAYQTSSGDSVALAERWNGASWVAQPTPGGAVDSYLSAVACPARSACTAFGFSHGFGTPLTMAQQWNGTSWRVQPTPSPAGAVSSQLNGVACTSPSACTGVGSAGNAALAERWNGTAWSRQPLPAVPGGSLYGVSCTSPSACMAVGVSGSGSLSERWDGTRWISLPVPAPAGVDGSFLDSISCTSATNCVAAGASFQASTVGSLAVRWNGTRWTILPTPNPAGSQQTFINGISCTSPSACTMTGEQHSASGIVHTVAERWDGATWAIQPTPNPPGAQLASLNRVDCTGPSACLAVGGWDQGTLTERWDGTAWTIQPTPTSAGGGFLGSVACSAPAACTAIGFTYTSAGGLLLAERWNGTAWSIQPTPLIPGAQDITLPDIACTSRSWCGAVGGYRSDGPVAVTLAEVWNGGSADSTAPLSTATAGPGAGCARPFLLARPGPCRAHAGEVSAGLAKSRNNSLSESATLPLSGT